MERALLRTMGPILEPLVRVTLSLFGSSPRVIFTRLATFTAPSVRGVQFGWTDLGPSSGRLTVTYDGLVPASFVAHYRGLVTYCFRLVGVNGHIVTATRSPDGHELLFEVGWVAGPG